MPANVAGIGNPRIWGVKVGVGRISLLAGILTSSQSIGRMPLRHDRLVGVGRMPLRHEKLAGVLRMASWQDILVEISIKSAKVEREVGGGSL